MRTKPVDDSTLTMLQKLAPVVADADVFEDGAGGLRLRFRWWNRLLLGAPGRNALRAVARVIFPREVRS